MSSSFTLEIKSDGIAYLTFDFPHEKINKITSEVLDELDTQIAKLELDDSVKLLIIKSAKSGMFIAGADLKTFQNAFENISIAEKLIQRGHQVFSRLESLSFPTVALINGICLGGGTELALSCTYRVVTDSPKVQIGLPETTLGIVPGWGGTQRLPRLIALDKALNMILSGKPIDAKKAYKIHFADAIISDEFWEENIKKFVRQAIDPKGKKAILNARKKSGLRHFLLEGNPIGRTLLYQVARKNVFKKTKGFYPAPIMALDIIKETFTLSLKKGLKQERDFFAKNLHIGFPNAIHLINLFFAQENLKKNPGIDTNIKTKKISYGAVIGAGTMGAPIAWIFTKLDIPVRLKDINWQVLGKGYGTVWRIYQEIKKKRKINSEQAMRKFQLVSATTEYTGFKKADLIIEAALENVEIKERIYEQLEKIVSEKAIIATNTSSLTVNRLAKNLKHPERFLGMHFFNPPNRMPLVEIIAGEKTSPEALAQAATFCKQAKKVPLVVKDCPGFLVNRIFATAANEAYILMEEGVEMESLEKTMLDFGMPMGPFTLSDSIGNDVAYKVFKTFEAAYGMRMKLAELPKLVYEEQLFGKKIGKGFYLYKGKKKIENPKIKQILKHIDAPKRDVAKEDILDRIILAMVNEASRCLDEKIVNSPSNLDLALIYGVGFPPFRGGLLIYADEMGISTIVDRLLLFQERYGKRFEPSQALISMKEKKQSFYS